MLILYSHIIIQLREKARNMRTGTNNASENHEPMVWKTSILQGFLSFYLFQCNADAFWISILKWSSTFKEPWTGKILVLDLLKFSSFLPLTNDYYFILLIPLMLLRIHLPLRGGCRHLSRSNKKATNLVLTVVTVFMLTNLPYMIDEFMRQEILTSSW